MCKNMMAKVAQSEQIKAVVSPEVLMLFEDWMEELEHEALRAIKKAGVADPMALAEDLGLSRSGAQFLIAKLKKEQKL
jgi:hypothetical protein